MEVSEIRDQCCRAQTAKVWCMDMLIPILILESVALNFWEHSQLQWFGSLGEGQGSSYHSAGDSWRLPKRCSVELAVAARIPCNCQAIGSVSPCEVPENLILKAAACTFFSGVKDWEVKK
jgi:hypothetical protein